MSDNPEHLGGPGTVWPIAQSETTQSLARRLVEAWYDDQREAMENLADEKLRLIADALGIELSEVAS